MRYLSILIGALGTAACGSSTTSPSATARIAVVQAATNAGAVTLTANGSNIGGSVEAGTVSPFASVPGGAPTLTIIPASGSAVAVTGTQLILGVSYDLLVVDSVGTLDAQLLPDLTYDTLSGEAQLRFAHASRSLASDTVNVYVTPAGASPTTTVFTTVGFPNNTGYLPLSPGTYQVLITPAHFPDSVVARVTGLALAAKQGRTIVLADAAAGGTTALVVDDPMMIETQDQSYTNP
jgi:hypothetical protein